MPGLHRRIAALALCSLLWWGTLPARGADLATLSEQLSPWLELFQGRAEAFTLTGRMQFAAGDQTVAVDFSLVRGGEQDFELQLTHTAYEVIVRRRETGIAFALPKHEVVFVGQAALPEGNDHLQPAGAVQRLVSSASQVKTAVDVLSHASRDEVASLLLTLFQFTFSAERQAWMAGDDWLSFDNQGLRVTAEIEGVEVQARLERTARPLSDIDAWPGLEQQPLPRAEIELQLARGLRRALEIVAPAPVLTSPKPRAQQVEHGELIWIEGSRVAVLAGTPEEIGTAHAQLLAAESQRCIDSVLYTFGTVQTVIQGRWFREDLQQAYAQLAAHIPERHRRETRALAVGLGVSSELLEAVNVFPEMFHCSGFAVSGSATSDGKLYHGRVLDYMTTIGLQDAATTFIVAPEGQIPFANVGYAGFTGCVSGMNMEAISVGEMGGRGEGQWNGVPMATLMRRAIEECRSLEEVQQLWRDNPRTCEYFYVFADGQTRTACGVAATPEKLEFIAPGEAHPLLGAGIPDAVVLSAGDRLEELRRRVQAGHGELDVAAACQLMARPVAMESNLHNVLFVPEDGVLFVANATHRQPAAERPYVRLSLAELLSRRGLWPNTNSTPLTASQSTRGLPTELSTTTVPQSTSPISSEANQRFTGRDSIDVTGEASVDAQQCLQELSWPPASFEVYLEQVPENLMEDVSAEWLVRFPSPRPVGDAVNDRVAMEWYQVRDSQGAPTAGPAAIIVHESGSGMTVGRLIARSLRAQGIHTFMLQLPYYGVRRQGELKPSGARLAEALCQSVADARRARDAVAVLPGVDPQRISLQGTSLGGFVTATTAGLDQAFHRVFILLAGGDIYGVLSEGAQDASKVRRAMLSDGMSEEQLRVLLQRIEPLRLAHRLDPQRVWLFSGRFDDVVPPRSSQLLATAARLDAEHHVQLLANHYSGIIFLPMLSAQMSQLMKE